MANRRDFLKQASLLVAGGVVGSNILSCHGRGASASKTPQKHIGLVMYSLRGDIKEHGIQKMLEIVAGMGYVNLEVNYGNGGFYDINPAEFKKMVDDLGMKATGSHLSRSLSENHDEYTDWWKKAAEAHAAAGMKYMVMPSWPLGDERNTLEHVKIAGDYFNEIGLVATGANLAFGYHNHGFEFSTKIDNVPVYDLLIENTNPGHVFFQNDVYWTQEGGCDPVEYLKKYPKRIRTLHIKDEKAVGASGTMDFKAIFDQAYANGVKDWFVEVEKYDGTPQEDVKKSYDFLAKADYVK
jgi:sugar phosphate isomerase/epimerase